MKRGRGQQDWRALLDKKTFGLLSTPDDGEPDARLIALITELVQAIVEVPLPLPSV